MSVRTAPRYKSLIFFLELGSHFCGRNPRNPGENGSVRAPRFSYVHRKTALISRYLVKM